MKNILLSLILIPILLMQPAPSYFVAPYGTAGGDGSADAPRTLAWALSGAPAGSTVWLIPGTYQGDWVNTAPGVTYRSLPGTRAKLDGSLWIDGMDTTWRDLEITNTTWLTRTSQYAGSPVSDLPQSRADVHIGGARTRLLHNVIHDLGLEGVGFWLPAIDSEVAYNLIYNIGWKGSDAGHGPALYSQNRDGLKRIHDNIMWGAYNGLSLEVYGSSAAYVRNYAIDHNVHIGLRALIGGKANTDAITVSNELMYGGRYSLGYTSQLNGRASMTDSYIARAALEASYWDALTVTSNRIANLAPGRDFTLNAPTTKPYTYTIDANQYWYVGSEPFNGGSTPPLTWAAWRSKGYDGAGQLATTLPTQNVIFTRSWDAQHGHVVVFNWEGKTSIPLDLNWLTPGASYRLVNAQNPGESMPFVAGVAVAVPTGGGTGVAPYASSAPHQTVETHFLTFLVEPA